MTCKVLIVEDEPLIAESLCELLGERDYDVVGTAKDTEQAFALAERGRPDVAVVDVRLADSIDGISLAMELASRYGTVVLFMTGNPQTVYDRAWEFRYSVLAKPFTDEEFLGAISEACRSAVGA